MKVTEVNEVKVYNVGAGKHLPEWIGERRRRALQKEDKELRERIELIQDFQFSTCGERLKASADGDYILATGTYPPRVRCYELSQLSMKFERSLDSRVVQFQVLSDDFSKMLFLGSDRSLTVHAKYGYHYRTRIPRFGRDLAFHYPTSDAYVVGASSEVYRLNLEQGRFMTSLPVSSPELTSCGFSPANQLFAAGGVDGVVTCFDPRCRDSVGTLDVAESLARLNLGIGSFSTGYDGLGSSSTVEVSSLRFAADGLGFAVGTSSGHVMVFDVRSSIPVLVKDHQYGFPIVDLKFHTSSGNIVSTDKKVVKIWDASSGDPLVSIEPDHDINDICLYKDSGMLMAAVEDSEMLSYYIPALGAAPRWASFLDSLTEELEQTHDTSAAFDDYKFVTKKDLEELGLSHLIGTPLLRAYMHGFFMDLRLYKEAQAVAQPFEFAEYKKNKIAEALQKQTDNRIQVKANDKLPALNKEYAQLLMSKQKKRAGGNGDDDDDDDDGSGGIKHNEPDVTGATPAPLSDPRFAAMWSHADYKVDTDSTEFKLLNPNTKVPAKKSVAPVVANESDSEVEGRPESDSESSDEEEVEHVGRDRQYNSRQAVRAQVSREVAGPKMYTMRGDVKDATAAVYGHAGHNSEDSAAKRRKKVPLGARIDSGEADRAHARRTATGGLEYTFKHEKKKSAPAPKEDTEVMESHDRKNRRGVKELRLPRMNGNGARGRRGGHGGRGRGGKR